ncbi:MAG: hypothetical protein AB7F22_34150 [Reyranella sp.]|uniref:hypothetical protein n=1 Tax=Reyranella sp. TaxID=1929291 RepID=UPI003D1282B9
MQKQWPAPALVALAMLLVSVSAHPWDLREVARQFLQRHGVPCPHVLKVDRGHHLGEVATCQDGRQWILLWLEDEIAFVRLPGHELYRWDSHVFDAHPEIFSVSRQANQDQVAVADFP